ncbi:MAG: hypothetical protein QOD50_1615 [Actinomycetota bacterium]|nr:hypothetical protein [Actinomycetota bacterium]
MNNAALFIAVFLACVVEAVEATTIVLAAGATRNWRSALTGVIAGILVLAVAVAIAGPSISLLPLGVLRLVVGGLLLIFGLQWMRKAILRASGYKPLHDETLIYSKQVAQAKAAEKSSRLGVSDWYSFTLAFKGVVLEGLEVVFIVLTFGTNQHNLPLASLAAGIAIVLVVTLGAIVRGPLSRVPENTLKFVVGIMLTSFGAFWGAEGAGAKWPGADTSLLIIAPSVAVFSLLIVWIMGGWRRSRARRSGPAVAESTANPESATNTSSPSPVIAPKRATLRSRLRDFGLFWYDFVIGDDWLIAAGVALGLALVFLLSTVSSAAWIVALAVIAVLLPWGIRRALR